MEKYEYKILKVENADAIINPNTQIHLSNRSFSELGTKGWELVAVDNGISYFKRRTTNE